MEHEVGRVTGVASLATLLETAEVSEGNVAEVSSHVENDRQNDEEWNVHASFVVPFFINHLRKESEKEINVTKRVGVANRDSFFLFFSFKQQTAQATTKGLSEKAGQPPLETTKGGGQREEG